MKNTNFIKNKAEYFGGAIFSDYNNLINSNIKNTSFIENYAYAGGAIYIKQHLNYSLFNIYDNNISYINNTSESHGPNVATDPYIIKLIDNSDLKNLTITSGESHSLKFQLFDELDQTIFDYSK